jgi:hypothetical protein
MAKRSCKGTTKAGKPCKAHPLTGKDYCSAHDPSAPDGTRFGSPSQASEAGKLGGAAGRKPRVVDVMRERVEAKIDEVLAPYFDTLEKAMLHATSDGEVKLSEHPDLSARVAAAEKLLDRVYGKPMQTTALTGSDGGAIRVEDVFLDPKVRESLHAVVERAGAARAGRAGGDGAGD